ncbi:MAG: SpoIIE family protein phosphatase [Ahniella sp.]|nr:SpoIIE family protein phosphatase [Ahniella sp.]
MNSVACPRPAESARTARPDPLALIAELSQSLALSLNLEATLKLAISRIVGALDVEAASVFMADEESGVLRCLAAFGPVDIVGLELPANQGIVGRTFQSRSCQMVDNTAEDPDFTGAIDKVTGFRTRSMISTPLLTAQGAIGVLQAVNKRDLQRFDLEDRNLLRALASPLALAAANASLAASLVEQSRIKRELELARRMQRNLLPRRRRGDFPILALHRPAREISGDFYEYFELADGRIAFAMGDVAGKGLDAAFLMVRCASLLRWTGKEGQRPSEWLARVNRELCDGVQHGSFVCALAGIHDPRTGETCWANAGLPSVLRMDADGVQRFRAEGPPLGILPEMDFPEQHTCLAGASLYLFSDGVTDARRPDGSMLGMEGAEALLQAGHEIRRPQSRLRVIASRLRQLELGDDTTLMLIEGP